MRKLVFFLGIISPVIFIFLSGLAAHLTPNFDSMQSPASNLAAGQFGWLQDLAFVVGGAGFTLIGISIYLNAKSLTKTAPSLIILFGVILVLEAIFQSNPSQSDSATNIHIMLFVVGMIGMLVSTVLFGLALNKISPAVSIYSLLTAVVGIIGFIGIFMTQGKTGMWQQIATGPLFLWLIVIDIYTFVKSAKLQAKK